MAGGTVGVAAKDAAVVRLEEAWEDRRRSAKSSLTPLRWLWPDVEAEAEAPNDAGAVDCGFENRD